MVFTLKEDHNINVLKGTEKILHNTTTNSLLFEEGDTVCDAAYKTTSVGKKDNKLLVGHQ